jgi:methylglutaconyl-CoA hydratase
MTKLTTQCSSFETISCTLDEQGIARLNLERPAVHNAFDETMIAELTHCFVNLQASNVVRAIVLGSSGKVFCAGADLNWMKRASANDLDANRRDADRFAAMMAAMRECSKPIVARVQGGAFGGGVGLLCACDIVIAGARAKFAVTEARFGIVPAVIGPYLVEAVGVREARRLALTAEVIDADEASAIGLAHHVVPDDELDAKVAQTLSTLLGNGPAAQQAIKSLFAGLAGRPIDATVRALTAQTIAQIRATDEAREGFAAFFDKRSPAWVLK